MAGHGKGSASWAAPRAFAWAGTWDLVGGGFPEGERAAVLTVTRRDTTYAASLAGPPGRVAALHVAGDSAHLVWDFGEPSGSTMLVTLRGVGDSLTGRWQVDAVHGPLRGARRR